MHHPEPTITVNGQKLSAVDMLTYLGSTLSRAGHINLDVNDPVGHSGSNVVFMTVLIGTSRKCHGRRIYGRHTVPSLNTAWT